MPHDEFELVLDRCRERLSEINLLVPGLETGAPRRAPPVDTLTPPPPATPALAAPAPAAPAPVQVPSDAAEAREDDEIFPPLRLREKTPVPSVPIWGAPAPPTPPPAPRPPERRRLAATVSAAAAVAATGAFGLWMARRPAPELSIPVDGADALAVRPNGRGLLVAQGMDLVDLALDGRTLSRRTLDAAVESMRWAHGSLWSVDGKTPSVVERLDGGRTTVYPLNHVPGAIYANDKYIWTAEKGSRVIHQFQISRSILGAILQPIDTFELDGLVPESFMIDDAGTLWAVQESTRRLYRLRLENGAYKLVSSAALSPFLGLDGKLRGLTIEEDAVWIMSQPAEGGRGALRRILLSRLDWTPA